MKPRTKLQKQVYELSIPKLNSKQKEWAKNNCFNHYYIHLKSTKENICIDCGHRWKGGNGTDKCPHCNAVLTFCDSSRKKIFKDWNYYSVIQTYKNFTVIRVFYIYKYTKIGQTYGKESFYEISQYWYDDNGGHVIMSKNKLMYSFFSDTPFSLSTPLTIKSPHSGYEYIATTYIYPKLKVSKILRRNGFSNSFRGYNPAIVMKYLLKDSIFETIWKQNDTQLIRHYINDSRRITRFWKQILKFRKLNYKIKDLSLWLDYLDLLSFLKKDINNPYYLFPENFYEEHDRLMAKKQKIAKQEAEQRRLQIEMERRQKQNEAAENFTKDKSKYFGITFGNSRIKIIVLNSIDAYKREGDALHHCVYTNNYYERTNSLILSARMADAPDIPIETIELSIKTGEILQCYGKYNRETAYHSEIISIVEQNSHLVLAV